MRRPETRPADIEEWRWVEEFPISVAQFKTVFWDPRDTESLRRLIREEPIVQGKTVLEIGTGSGLLSLCCLKAGASRAVATDVNLAAIANAKYNATRLGLADRLETRLSPLDQPEAYSTIGESERFDVVISNPPWENQTPASINEFALYDPDFALLRSLLSGLEKHLKPGGKAFLAYGCVDAIETLQRLAQRIQPRHPDPRRAQPEGLTRSLPAGDVVRGDPARPAAGVVSRLFRRRFRLESTAIQAERTTRMVVAGVIGNVLEWYDFALFGFFAPVISQLFFPSDNRIASLLATFGVFALGFLMRPSAAHFFGHIGDRLGRKKALELSVLMMAIPTTLVGLLPSYHQIGIAAPVILTVLRMLQGASVGGELIGSISFLGEHSPPERRGLLGSWTSSSATLGVLAGSGVAALVTRTLPPAIVTAWGWRVPFWCGFLVGLTGLWLRRGIAESPRFTNAVQLGEVAQSPVAEALRRDTGAILRTFGLAILMAVGFYLPFVWLSTWLGHIHRPPLTDALTINTIALAVFSALIPLGGMLSDRFGAGPCSWRVRARSSS